MPRQNIRDQVSAMLHGRVVLHSEKPVDNLVLFSIPVFLLSIVIEYRLSKGRRDVVGYEVRDTFASRTS